MNKKNITAILIATFYGSAHAEYNSLTPNFSADSAKLSLSAGVLKGEGNELLYEVPYGRMVSRLDWKIKNLPILNADYSWDAYSRITFNARGWVSLTQGSGYMDDYDWEKANQSKWTKHSWHPNTNVNYGNEYDLNLKIWFLKNENAKLGVVAGYQETRFSWTAYGGYYDYYNGTVITTTPNSERTIGYIQHFSMPYIGLSGGYRFGDFEINALLKFSNEVTAHDYDEHYLLRDYYQYTDSYQETSYNSNYYGALFNIGYYFNQNTKIFAEFVYNKYEEGAANMVATNSSTGVSTNYDTGIAGIANTNYSATIGIQYQF